MGPAHWDPKAISLFYLPGVKKHRLFGALTRSFCDLDPTNGLPHQGGIMPFSLFLYQLHDFKAVGQEITNKQAISENFSPPQQHLDHL